MKDVEKSRSNGCARPFHPLQVVAWTLLIVYAILHFTTLVPAVQESWQLAAYIIPGASVVAHILCHVIASSMDPADASVRRTRNSKLPFDRTRHLHVIENSYCYICQVAVGSKAKHCSVCNKCVAEFDHHCLWLNNCVGGRNYGWFVATLITAVISLSLVIGIASLEFVAYFSDRDDRIILQPYRDLDFTRGYEEAKFYILYQWVIPEIWLALLGAYILIGLAGLVLLVDLLRFHFFLMYKKISTYDYVLAQRVKQVKKTRRQQEADSSSKECCSKKKTDTNKQEETPQKSPKSSPKPESKPKISFLSSALGSQMFDEIPSPLASEENNNNIDMETTV